MSSCKDYHDERASEVFHAETYKRDDVEPPVAPSLFYLLPPSFIPTVLVIRSAYLENILASHGMCVG